MNADKHQWKITENPMDAINGALSILTRQVNVSPVNRLPEHRRNNRFCQNEEPHMTLKIVPFVFFILIAFGFLAGCAVQVKGPGIVFGSEIFDFGTIEEGQAVTHEFNFTNNGTEKLVIDGVIPSCGCTTAGDDDKEIPSGKSGKISVSLNTRGFDGRVTKTVLVETNVPEKESMTLTLAGTVKPKPAAAGTSSLPATSGAPYTRAQSGEQGIGGNATPSKQVTVTFATAFSGTPRVIATVRNDSGWDVGDTFAVTIRKVSSTQFTVNVLRLDSAQPWNQNPLLDWMAWE
jgi:hypothetical protein